MTGHSPISALISTFALMSLFAVGGAAAAVPEMHQIAPPRRRRVGFCWHCVMKIARQWSGRGIPFQPI